MLLKICLFYTPLSCQCPFKTFTPKSIYSFNILLSSCLSHTLYYIRVSAIFFSTLYSYLPITSDHIWYVLQRFFGSREGDKTFRYQLGSDSVQKGPLHRLEWVRDFSQHDIADNFNMELVF
jgi:hypothetical protein